MTRAAMNRRRILHLLFLALLPVIATTQVPAQAALPRFPNPLDRIWDSDAYWTRDFAVPGVDGAGTALGVLGSELFVGGFFTQIDGIESPGLARFNGLRWEPASTERNPTPSAMLADGSSMIIGGDFIDRRTRARSAVVRWERGGITPLGGSEMRGRIVRLFQWNSALIAAGELAFEDQPQGRYFLGRWNGTRWVPLGPDHGNTSSDIRDAVPFQGRIAVGGRFGDGPTPRALLLLRGDGSAFDTLLADTTAVRIEKLEVHAGRLVAGGAFQFTSDPSGRVYHNLAAWDGTAWTPLDDEFSGGITALRSTPTGLLIGGTLFRQSQAGVQEFFSVARLEPTGLRPLHGLEGTYVLSLVEWQGKVVACGRLFRALAGFAGPSFQLAVFDGSNWRSPGAGAGRVAGLDSYAGIPGYANTTAFLEAGGNWFAGGSFDLTWNQDRWVPLGPIGRWNGTGWEDYGQGISFGGARALAWYKDQLYAAGSFSVETPAGYVTASLIRSDGIRWVPVDGAPQGEIRSLVVYGDLLMVGGMFQDAGGIPVGSIASFDGQGWAAVGSAVPITTYPARIGSLLVHEGALYAGGTFESIAGIPANSIARWDGQSWSALGDGYSGEIQALAEYQGHIVAAGYCLGNCRNMMSWDGATWTGIPDAPSNVVAMASSGRTLFVGGYFPGSNGFGEANANLRAWDGTSWHALGSGLTREIREAPRVVSALAVRNDVLWVGGAFTRAGGQTAMNVATWTGLTWQGRREHDSRFDLFATPNPSRPGSPIAFEIAGAVAAEVAIYDLAGRRLHSVFAVPAGDGAAATWDGRDADGREVPAGIYFARVLREGRVIATRRLVRLP